MPRFIPYILLCSALFLSGCQNWQIQDIENLPPPAALPESSIAGEVQVFYWDNISGNSVEALISNEAFPESPDSIELLNELRRTPERGSNYGSLVRGYILPPATGAYTFFVSGDDETEFWLSPSADNTQKQLVAEVPAWTYELVYTKYASQRSSDIQLTAGNRYYFEIIHKEGSGGDHFSVAWERPGLNREIISAQNIASFAGEPGSELSEQGAEESYRLGYSVGYLDGSEGLAFNPNFPPLDEDQDGIYDNWEIVHGLDSTDPTDANSDPDNDLLVAADEFLLGTLENNPDTDGDGIPDGDEFALGIDPLDPSDAQGDLDGDGFTNLEEYLAGTNPTDSESIPEAEPISDLTYARGFAGQYFDGINFDRFLSARNDENIQFQSSSGSFAEGQPSDYFSARWFGEFTAPHSSGSRSYTYRVRTDDGTRLYVAGEPSISAWRDQGATVYTTTVSLEPGQNVDVLMEYYERGGAAVAQLSILDDSTGTELVVGDVIRSPDLSVPSETDTDADGIPDTWELRNGLSPWRDDASEINNNSGVTNIDAFNSSLSPWTLEPLASPESPTVDDGSTSTPATSQPETGTATLSWTAPLTRVDGSSISLSEIQSYEILYGSSPESLSNTITVDGSQTSAEITGLSPGTWYFAIRVIDTDGLTSENSQILTHTVQ
ncbi:fibronectin type III domain-containing protein [Marinobacter salsuginis]|uniref:PA14 domain-containing protein n=1 Tax=Marinobacter salsuginis TaxID=418719 RepID=UPI001C98167F|nr:PA14 domain-containing protein [Marinobacter salsuginis]MBY6070334.1 fibronectin type III domain-containing protein [Marinobacter salsuginis]